jgi:endonuclease/exonuclease/phosphatase family metal-dependent hydrolase
LWIASLASVAAGCSSGEDCGAGAQQPVVVLTHNLYLGADLTRLALASGPDSVPTLAAQLWKDVQASDYPARSKVLAAQIVESGADLVALQEVTLYRRQFPSDYVPGAASPNATEVVLDFLGTLMAEIEARGGGYVVAGVAENADAEFPVADLDGQVGGTYDLRLTDRDVILARDGVVTSGFAQTVYPTAFSFSVGGAGGVPVLFKRSTSHLAAVVGSAAFTFGNGHLEIQGLGPIHAGQAQELVDAYATIPAPVLLAGDFNSPPNSAEYGLLARQFTDAWTRTGQGDGFTCCQADDLMNPTSTANERIDLVLYKGTFRPTRTEVLGADPMTGRTPAGKWPTDHFAVRSTLSLPASTSR